MKRIFTLALFLGTVFFIKTTGVFAQCNIPPSYPAFQSMKGQLMSVNSPFKIYQMGLDMARRNCFSSEQLRDLAGLFANDRDRLEFCKAAYPNVVDKQNIEEVYDAFYQFSNAIRFYKFISTQPTYNTNTQYNTYVITYPNLYNYRGSIGCNALLNDISFQAIKQQIAVEPNENIRFMRAVQTLQNNCPSMAQVMETSMLFEDERNRLDFFKKIFPNVYDVDNAPYFTQVLNDGMLKNACTQFINSGNFQVPPPVINPPALPVKPAPVRCGVSEADFQQIKASIQKISFASTKESQAKTILQSKKCFTAAQIKELVKLFNFESSKVEIAKFAYDYCVDKPNYFVVNDAFSFSSSTEELNKYISTR